jgi:hypothetical protein
MANLSPKNSRILLEKLELETRRSAFLNCLQGHSSGVRFDLAMINQIQPFAARDVINTLFMSDANSVEVFLKDIDLAEEINMKTEADNIDDMFRKLHSKSNEILKETGRHSCYIGFPLLSHLDSVDPSRNFIAPLIFWPVTISPGRHFDRWIIYKNENVGIRLNYALNNWLINNKMQLPEEPKESVLQSCRITYVELENYLSSIASIFNIPSKWKQEFLVMQTMGPNAIPYVNLKSINADNHCNGFAMNLSAIIGIFQANKEGIIQDLKSYAEQGSSLELDSSGWPLFSDFPLSLVELDPSQWSTHETIGRGLNAVVHGPPGTGKSTVLTGIVSTALANNRKVLMISEKRTALDVIASKLNALGLDEPFTIITDVYENRRDLVVKARSLHDRSLDWDVKPTIDTTKQLRKWEALRNAYQSYCNELNEVYFNGMRFEELLLHYLKIDSGTPELPISEEIIKHVDSNRFEEIRKYFSGNHGPFILNYLKFYQQVKWPIEIMCNADSLIAYRENKLNSLSREIQFLDKQKDILEELIPLQTHHDEYMIEGVFLRNLMPYLSKGRRKHLRLLKQLLRWQVEASTILDFRFELQTIHSKLNTLKASYSQIDQFKADNGAIELSAESFSKIVKHEFTNALSDIITHLEYENPSLVFEKSVIRVLLDRKRKTMDSLFKWNQMNEAVQQIQELREAGKQRARQLYRNNVRRECSRAERSYGLRRLYNLRGGKGHERNSLRQIVQADPELYLNLFPITLCTPEVASVLFTGVHCIFDLVVFDEASQIRVEDAYTCLFKGKAIVVSGDRHQMPPSSWFEAENDDAYKVQGTNIDEILETQALQSESILNFAIEHRDFCDTYLTYHYRSEHPHLIAFSNSAFYGNLRPMAMLTNSTPFSFHHVAGLYYNQTNETEAGAILDYLMSIKPYESGTFPSIGIVTLNLKQRDLIIKLITRERRQYEDFNLHITQLEQVGLFIRNLENIQGDERDIIVLSTTFGINKEGKFTRHFGKLGTRAGYRLLNVLVTRARKKVEVFTSIPEIELQEFDSLLQSKRGNWGAGLLYAYLEFIRRASNGHSIDRVIKLLSSLREEMYEMDTDEIELSRLSLIQLLLHRNNKLGEISIGSRFAGVLVDAHDFNDGYYLNFGARLQDSDNLIQLIHRTSYLTSRGIHVKELA